MSGFDVKRKRPSWFGWIPASILLVIIAGVGIAAAVLVGNGLGRPAPLATGGQVTDLNWSIFTEEGRAYIDRTREVRIDFSQPPVEAAKLGLADDGSVTIGPYDSGDVQLTTSLIVNGGGEAPGGAKLTFGKMTITTADGLVVGITGGLPSVDGFRPTLNTLIADAPVYGWDTGGLDAIYQQVENATRDGSGYEFSFGPGSRLGIDVTATARCEASGYCAVEYDVAPSVR